MFATVLPTTATTSITMKISKKSLLKVKKKFVAVRMKFQASTSKIW